MSDDRNDRGPKGRAAIEEIDRRLGGVLGPLAEGLARLVDAAEAARRDGSQGGGMQGDGVREATVQTSRGPVRIRSGLSVRVGGLPGEAARPVGRDPAEPVAAGAATGGGAAPADAGQPAAGPADEPPHDLFATEDAFALSADLPGATEATLTWGLRDAMLTIETPAPRRRRLTVPCPAWLDAGALRISLVNGVLEMTAERRT